MNIRRLWPLRLLAAAVALTGIVVHAQITQPTFTASEVGTVVFRFTNDLGTPTSVALQPAFADYQHGRLYIGSGRDAVVGSTPLITWWNLANPRSPVLVQSTQLASGNKPHFATFWENKFAPGHQGPSEIWDYNTRARLSTYNSGAGALWRSLQPPYEFNTTNGYGSSPPLLEVASIDPATTNRTRLKLIDLSQLVGFYIGASHPLGNLLICSGSQARGVAVIDISDPVNPRVLSSLVTGNPIYTSFVHGSRLYTGEANTGVRVYDFASPQAITEVGFVDLPDNPRYISVKEGKGYVTPGSAKLCVFDAQNPAAPFTTYTLPAAADFTFPLGNMVVTAGQSGKNMCAIIAVDQAPDTQGPKVDYSSPPDRGTRQALTSRIGLVMSDQVDVTSLNSSNIIVRPVGSATALAGTYSTQMGLVNFSPATPLQPNTVYEVILPAGGVRDVVGNGLRQAFRMRFSTGDSVDDTELGLVSRYRFDETAGTTAADEVSARNGTLTNFPATPWGAGVIAGRLQFDGIDDFVNVGTFSTGNSFTIAGWLRIPSGFNNLNTIFTNSTAGFSATGLKLFVYGSTSTTAGRIQLETGNGTAGDAATTSNGVFQFDQWNHVAVTVDRARGTAAIYYNGVDRTSDASVRNDFQTSQVIQFGQMANSSNRLRGELDDLHLYDRVLYTSEIDALRTQRDGAIAHWRFNNTVADESGGNRSAVLQGATFATGAMEGTHAISLDGVNDYVDVGTLDVGQSFTFAGWVHVPAGTTGFHNLFGNAATGNAAAGCKLFLYGSANSQAGRLRVETGNGVAGGDAFTNTEVFQFGQWNHVALLLDRTNGRATIYVNGLDVTADATIRTDFPTNQVVQFGRMTDGGFPLPGAMDDIRLYGRTLGSAEVRVLSTQRPLAYWPLDNSGTDQGGFNRALTFLGGAGFSTDRAHGSHSLLLDGADDRASSPSIELGNAITLSTWVKIPSTPSGLETVLANGPTTYQGAGFRLFVYGVGQSAAGRIQIETGNGTTGDAANTAVGTFQFDQWNHVAVTINRATGVARIFYNRVDVTVDQSVRNDFPTNAPIEIGSMAAGANTMVGRVDDVRVFGAIATAAQINALGEGSANVAPVATAITSSNPKQATDDLVTFTATANDGNVGETLTYSYDFGDGTRSAWSASRSAAHSYSAPGRYVVTVFVDDGYTVSTRSFVQIVHRPLTPTAPAKSGQVAYDPGLSKVWIVNPDIDTVTRIDANTRARDFEQPVGAKPSAVAVRPGVAEVWVACRETGEIRVLNSSTGAALATIPLGRGYAPTGLAFAPNGSAAFVACEGAEALLKLNPVTRTVTTALDLGSRPRAVAVSADSARVFVSRFISSDTQGEVWEVVPGTMTLAPLTSTRPANPSVLGIDSTPDSENGGRGLPNYLLDAGISPDGRRLWLPAKKDNIQRGTGPGKTGGALDADNTVRSILCQIELTGNVSEVRVARKDVDDQGLGAAVCFSPVGDLVFVAFITNNEVLAFDTVTGNQVAGATVGFAPSGLTMNPTGTRLYVHNFLSRSVTTLDVAALVNGTSSSMPALGTTNLIVTEKLAAQVLTGKRIFYNANDPRMSGEGYMSCASCHLDGDHDGRTWDFTDRGEGFRNTTTLLGRSGMGHGPVHWTGNFDEIQDFEHDIRGGFGGTGFMSDAAFSTGTRNTTLGLAKAGVSAELDAMAAYVASLTAIPRSPFRNANGTLTTAAVAGQAHFTSKGCATCHSGSNFTNSALGVFRDVGTINPSSGKRLGATLTGFDTPSLRGVWATFPYLHRGQAPDLLSVFSTANAPAGKGHDRFRELTIAQQDELLRYLMELE